MRACNFLPL